MSVEEMHAMLEEEESAEVIPLNALRDDDGTVLRDDDGTILLNG